MTEQPTPPPPPPQQQQQQESPLQGAMMDASEQLDSRSIDMPPPAAPHQEISPTKNSLRLMRQISGLGMEDPVFGLPSLSVFDDDDDDFADFDNDDDYHRRRRRLRLRAGGDIAATTRSVDDHHNTTNHDTGKSNSSCSSKNKNDILQRRGSLVVPLPLLDLFADMGFDDLPKDMRDALSVASDPTAAHCCQHQAGAFAIVRGGGGNDHGGNAGAVGAGGGHRRRRKSTNSKGKLVPTPDTSTNNSSFSHTYTEPVHDSNDDEDTTTCTLTKDTLLAEAAQALEGRVPSDLIAAARYQISHHQQQQQHQQATATTTKRQQGGHPNPCRTGAAAKPHWKKQPAVVARSSSIEHRVLPTLESIFPV